MKEQVSIYILCLLLFIACATNNKQIPKSLSPSYDGIWDGYAQLPEELVYYDPASNERIYIKAEIKDGIVSGFIGDTKVKGYVSSDNKLLIDPIYGYIGVVAQYAPPDKIIIETNFMSPSRIEGTYHADRFDQTPKYNWYLVKPATGKSDILASNAKSGIATAKVRINKSEPWTGKFQLESNYHCSGIWAMKQEGKTVNSTSDSDFVFKGKVQGNQLKGKMKGASSTYYPFTLEMSSDSKSIAGTLDFLAHGLPCQLKGQRIE